MANILLHLVYFDSFSLIKKENDKNDRKKKTRQSAFTLVKTNHLYNHRPRRSQFLLQKQRNKDEEATYPIWRAHSDNRIVLLTMVMKTCIAYQLLVNN